MPDLVQTMNMFGSPPPQTQWLNYRYPAEASFTSANNLSIPLLPALPPHGLKQEQEENKRDLSHCANSVYFSDQNPQGEGPVHMSATSLLQKAAQIGSTRINNDLASTFNNNNNNHNNVFGLIGSNILPTTSSNRNNINNIVGVQKFLKQANMNELVNLGGGFSLNDTSSKNKEQLGLTRDFLGVGDESLSRPFLQQDLAEFNAIGSLAMELHDSQYGGHYC